ncbi:GTP 3',8-cyclase MoaA [Verrucomicrobiota bacterium]
MRKVNYIRLSTTDRCNLRCIYCMPHGKDRFLPHAEVMRYEEMVAVVKLLVTRGVQSVRITGGEPLVRRNVEQLVGMLKKINGAPEVSMTTNGVLLDEKLSSLLANGLDRINISLNSLKKETYRMMTGVDACDRVRRSIDEILERKLLPLKINVVICKGINDDEVEDFAGLSLANEITVRFIEYFPTGNGTPNLQFVSNAAIRERIEKRFGPLVPVDSRGYGPAVTFRIEGSAGRIGFINTRTSYYCAGCGRLRLTSEGRLFPCLFSPASLDLKKLLREKVSKEEIMRKLDEIIQSKNDYSKKLASDNKIEMSSMGG